MASAPMRSPSTVREANPPHAAAVTRGPRLALIQTQAEGAGAQEITRILGNGLTDRGYEVHHVFFFRRTAAFDRQQNTYFCARERPSGPRSLARMLTRLVRHLRELNPDVALCFQHYGNVFGTGAARLAGVRRIVANRTSSKLLEPRWTRLADLAFGSIGLFDRMVVNSQSVADEYVSHPSRYRDRLLRIDHGFEPKQTNLTRAETRLRLGLPADVGLLGSVARLHPTKNLAAAIRLLSLRPEWHLALAGQGPDRQRLEELARALNVAERVHFTGELSPAEVGVFLKALDLFVFPTRMETFGLAVVEAAQAGVPVVANDLEVLREVLAVDGAPCALFADVDDLPAFARATERLLQDRELRTVLSARAAKLARRYSVDAMVRRYEEAIAAVLAKPR
jgi:glycosyltransferase involved in cell wall biosynthesis